MDPISGIKPYKDSSFAMMLAAQSKGWEVYYIAPESLTLLDGTIVAELHPTTLRDDNDDWFTLAPASIERLSSLDAVLMRQDPPFDMEYVYITYLLEKAEAEGLLVVNKPASLRDANEKAFTMWFQDYIPDTLIGRDMAQFKRFLEIHKTMIVKPLDGMGGASIFRITEGDPNTNVILETLTNHGKQTAMGQQFLPEYVDGDKRILLIDSKPVPYALARLPAAGEGRANLAAGGTYKGVPLTQRDMDICEHIAPELQERGLIFTGIDVIGDYMTEINVTSPTGIRELDKLFDLDIGGILMDCIDSKLDSA